MRVLIVLGVLLVPVVPSFLAWSQAPLQLPLTCSTTARAVEGEAGTTATGTCPANCPFSVIWGTDIYTDDSSICVAAVHSGAVPVEGGPVIITIEAGQPSYEGTVRNDISSTAYGQWGRSFRVAAAGEAPQQPAARAADASGPTCSTTLPDQVIFRNEVHQYCLSHHSRWEVVENSSSSVTIRIPPAVTGESMALNITVSDEAMPGIDLDAVIDEFISDFFPQQDQFQQVQIVERTDAIVAGQPAKFLAFGGKLAAGDQLLDVVGHVYVFAAPNDKLYSLTFIMDTSRLPQEAYEPTLRAMRDSFLVAATSP